MLVQRWARWAVVLLGAGLELSSPAAQADDTNITLETIRKAWQQRQEHIRSFRFHWDERRTLPRGSYLSGKKPEPGNPDSRVVPAQTTTYDTSYSMTMEGSHLRYVSDQLTLSRELELIHQKGIVVYTKLNSKALTEPGATPYSQGYIGPPAKGADFITEPQRLPLLLMYRPLAAETVYLKDFPRGFQLMPGRFTVETRSCVQVKQVATRPSQVVTTLWLDPERAFLVVRMTRSDDRGPLSQMTFHEFRKEKHGWVPQQWTRMFLSRDGAVGDSSIATVREASLNVPVWEKEFDIEFPAGTWVTDDQGGSSYIVKEGGEKRFILKEEAEAGYERLLNTETGRALEKPRRGWGWWWVAGALVALVAAGTAITIFRRRARGQSLDDARV